MTCLRFLAHQEGQEMFEQHRHSHGWSRDSKFYPTYKQVKNTHLKETAGKCGLLIILKKPAWPFVSAWFLLVSCVCVCGGDACDVQCSFTGFLISVPHEGVFMLTTGDSTLWHYCIPTREYRVRGSTKAHSDWDWHKLNKSTQPGWKYRIVSVIRSDLITYNNYDKYTIWHC